MDSKFASKFEDLERRLLDRPGTLDPEIRRAAAEGEPVPKPLDGYVDTVRRHAYRVTDQDILDLKAAGYSEDQIFEVTVAAAFGAAKARLMAGLDALAGTARETA
jgi:alkylhydroperoxidase family enzyme